mmetsp:Transcript_35465/g.55316  ORF Transcript_35465/g.55316 Transcript_35465/m.55316 type:complete len:84 (-) Transcript_35465:238-489(-)
MRECGEESLAYSPKTSQVFLYNPAEVASGEQEYRVAVVRLRNINENGEKETARSLTKYFHTRKLGTGSQPIEQILRVRIPRLD